MIEIINRIKLVEKQNDVEEKTTSLRNKMMEDAERLLVRHLTKHQSYCQILIDICSEKNLHVRDRNKLLKLIEMGIKLEVDLIQHLQLMINENDALTANILLHEYETEEKMHYDTLQQLLEQMLHDNPHDEMLRPSYSPEMNFTIVPSLRLFLKELKMKRNGSKRCAALIL